jgi:hypothetical protein
MKHLLLALTTLFLISQSAFSQSPGIIVRPAGGNGTTPLNPNGDGFSSATTNGFINSDITESEVPYKIVPPSFSEPTSDLLRGPGTLYSDLVTSVDGSGFYVYSDGTNLMFRLRVDNIVSGSKGYSVLIDTDGKFGNTGPYADPNYVAATTGVNGNPGFELEVDLETNFQVAAYNVDGTSTPSPISAYGINTNSQISVALSTVSGTPDYFYDFYVPISALGITNSTPLRMAATTVMAPLPAIGGPKSDIFGVNDASYHDPMVSWQAAINNTPSFTLSNITSSGSGIGSVCTAAPTLTSPIQAGSGITISGTWTALDATKPQSATITLYKNSVSAGTTTASSGSTWSISGITVAAGDVLYAKAQAVGESQCLQSPNVTVVSCSAANTSSASALVISCATGRGIEGTMAVGSTVKIYKVTSTGVTLFADSSTTTYHITYPTTTSWRYDDVNGQGSSSACSGGSPDLANGGYMVTVTQAGKCESPGVYTCITSSGTGTNAAVTATPTIAQTALYNGASTVSGIATASSTVRLYKNGLLQTSVTADGSGNYSFTGLGLVTGDSVSVTAQTSGNCVSAAVNRTVNCFTTPPVMTAGNFGNLSTAATAISGTSGEPSGTVVTIYENGVSKGTTTVQSNGTWSFTYTPVAGKGYTATQQNGTCSASAASTADTARTATTVCPSITGSYTASTTSVTGTLPSSFSGTIRLYLDGTLIGSTTVTSATTWTISSLNTTYNNTLYAGGVLTVTSQVSGGAEKTDCGSSVTLSCALPTTPSISPTSSTIFTGQTVTYTVNSSVSGILYGVTSSTSSTTNYAISKWGTGSNLSVPTTTFSTPGTYNVLLSAISLSGPGCITSAAAVITVNSALPIKLAYFTGHYENNQSQLEWKTLTEVNANFFAVERSDDGRQFTQIGTVKATGNSTLPVNYAYTDKVPVNGSAWYRLKTVDIDGKSEYSNVIRIINNNRNVNVLSVMPNPFESNVRMQVYADKSFPAIVRVADLTGREMYRTSTIITAGNNNITLNLPLSLSKGMYLLQLISNNEVIWKQKIEKIK